MSNPGCGVGFSPSYFTSIGLRIVRIHPIVMVIHGNTSSAKPNSLIAFFSLPLHLVLSYQVSF